MSQMKDKGVSVWVRRRGRTWSDWWSWLCYASFIARMLVLWLCWFYTVELVSTWVVTGFIGPYNHHTTLPGMYSNTTRVAHYCSPGTWVPLIRENGWTTLGTRRLQLTLTAKPIIGATWILNLSQPDHISNNKQVISSTYTGNNRTAPTIVTADLSDGYIPGTYLLTVDLY